MLTHVPTDTLRDATRLAHAAMSLDAASMITGRHHDNMHDLWADFIATLQHHATIPTQSVFDVLHAIEAELAARNT